VVALAITVWLGPGQFWYRGNTEQIIPWKGQTGLKTGESAGWKGKGPGPLLKGALGHANLPLITVCQVF